ncbi:hypothetical protein SLNWT_2244 [Streptomyces albus]|uniref:Uncharacterized protein n=1 Tax=Streptomyces albus (strain ATCC 21838 / DSM 41398 / FERM P-419 / JCM 4703 / NBRC 107858) TaxID=1081613 RepID=A0A0B5ETP7_STRA4|nr:hypothetical protein SLNWT_2244 [Streptomyces albus]AOU76933.1 hypothetical protein SLNHY_2242 [Streptomyces albus]AYN32711.1 hypothetical protein DUI70_2208 [Streptomyces albus]
MGTRRFPREGPATRPLNAPDPDLALRCNHDAVVAELGYRRF